MRRQIRDRRTLGYGSGPAGNAAPTVASVYPPIGFKRGSGLALTITGTGFLAGATVTINGLSPTGVTVVSPTLITCTSPTFAGDGAFDIVVTNTDTKSGTGAGAYIVRQAAAWFKQTLGVSPPGGPVATWADQSGSGADATQSTGASQPLVITGYRNGKNALDCSGAQWLQNTATSLIAVGAPITVLYCGNGGNNLGVMFTIRPGAGRLCFDIFGHGANNHYVHSDGGGGLVSALATDATITADHYSSYHLPDRVGANMTYFLNGVSQTMVVNAAIATESGTDGFQISNNDANQTLNNKILEEVIIAGNFSTQERQAWEAYCRTEYAFT